MSSEQGEVMTEGTTATRRCPRCGQEAKRWAILGVNLTNRWVFAVVVTAVFLAGDLFTLASNYVDFHGRYFPSDLRRSAWGAAGRFLLAYLVAHPYFAHSAHTGGEKENWRDHMGWALMIPLLGSVSFVLDHVVPGILRMLGSSE